MYLFLLIMLHFLFQSDSAKSRSLTERVYLREAHEFVDVLGQEDHVAI